MTLMVGQQEAFMQGYNKAIDDLKAVKGDKSYILGYKQALGDFRVTLSEVKRGNSLISYTSIDALIVDMVKKVKG